MLLAAVHPTTTWYLVLGALLFTIGAVGLMVRRNPLVMFMCVELMLNAVNLTFVTFAKALDDIGGQAIVFFVLVGQGREFVEALASETEDPRYWAHQLFFLAAVLIWFWTTWLTSVALLANQPARAVSDAARARKIERFMPRTLAFLSVLSVAIGSIVVARHLQGAAYLLLAAGLLALAWRYEDGVREALAQKSRVAVPAKINKLLRRGEAPLVFSVSGITRALLVPEQLAIAIDRWHALNGAAVADWLRIVGEIEALSALATYAYEHPADPFPALSADGPVFDAEGLGHPLLGDNVSVRNDVRLGGTHGAAPRVVIVSGSNMSGKSTWLRSVGVNVVLALAGAPIRAASLTVSPLVLGATLRVDDSLEAGQSRFYSEILRIRAIVESARGPTPLLFLLDEILHGTNSYDRRIGAEAIVRALVEAGAVGLVTTHDLALTELPARLGSAAVNMHFEDRLEDGRMVFDYRMRPGVVEHSNALALMRAIGLDV